MSQIIYVVTTGEYSDYRIAGVFSSKEKAQAFADQNSEAFDLPEIEEWPLDEKADWKNRLVWRVWINLNDGSITDGAAEREIVPLNYSKIEAWRSGFALAESSISKEHAIKIAAEFRQAWLREGGKQGDPEA